MRKRWYFVVPAAIVGIALFMFLGGELVMRLWNWLLPGLFGWRLITFWQAIGILTLCRILFRAHWGPRVSRLGFSRAHGPAMGAHDAGGARKIPARDARAVWLWAVG